MLRTWIAGCCLTAVPFTGAGGALAASPAPSGPAVSATDSTSGDFVFAPPTITIATGQSVTFVNTGQAAHTATADDASWSSANLDPGARYTTPPFTRAGTIEYKCIYHATLGMVGTIVVTGPGLGTPPPVVLPFSNSPSPDYTSPGIPRPSTAPAPPTQKYLPPIGGGLLAILLGGIAVGYLRLRRRRDD